MNTVYEKKTCFSRVVQNPGCVFACFGGGHKNNSRL